MLNCHRDLSGDLWMLSCLELNIMVSIEWCRNQDPTVPRSWTNNSQGWSMHEQGSEMDLVSSAEKPTLPCCFSHLVFQKKTREEEPGMATENWGWETNFPEKEILRGIRRNLFFSLCVTTKKSIFNHMGKIIQEPPYQKYWLEGWRLNMERHSDLLLLVKNYLPLVKTQRTRISLAQICPNLDVSHVRHDRSGQ